MENYDRNLVSKKSTYWLLIFLLVGCCMYCTKYLTYPTRLIDKSIICIIGGAQDPCILAVEKYDGRDCLIYYLVCFNVDVFMYVGGGDWSVIYIQRNVLV